MQEKSEQQNRINSDQPVEFDLSGVKSYIIKLFTNELNPNLQYHSLNHTLNVEKAVSKYAASENISETDTVLLRVAALFHDTGYIDQYHSNESFAVNRLVSEAPNYGFRPIDISFISELILSTSRTRKPANIFEKIICDADHDYLGTKHYHLYAELLFTELNLFSNKLSEKEWIIKQINYLQDEHKYHTQTAIKLRQKGKELRIKELKDSLSSLNFKK
ncbi:MAG: HD domain-containing protein [Crocinitomicaceae bacterium]